MIHGQAYQRLIEDTDGETAAKILSAFLKNLRAALDLHDPDALARSVHKLRSTAKLLGYADFSRACEELDEYHREHRSLAGKKREIEHWSGLGREILAHD